MKLIAAISVLLLVAWSSYRAGETAIELEYQKRLAEINQLSEESRKSSEVKINDLETQRVTEKQSSDERVKGLAKRLADAQRVKPGLSDNIDRHACSIPVDVVRVLHEAASDSRLPEASNPSGFIDPETTVTADHLAAYSFYTITEHNDCASDYNKLIEMVDRR